jgi:hypothetical protein
MKTFVKVMLLLLMTVVCGNTLSSCERERGRIKQIMDPQEMRAQDSMLVVKIIRDGINPSFNSVNELILFRTQLLENAKNDSMFKTIPETILRDIGDMCIHKYNRVDKMLVLKEYKAFMSNSIEKTEVPKVESSKEYQALQKDPPTIITVDTIINGKHWRLVEEGKTYVQ